jgi:hypothetical protein
MCSFLICTQQILSITFLNCGACTYNENRQGFSEWPNSFFTLLAMIQWLLQSHSQPEISYVFLSCPLDCLDPLSLPTHLMLSFALLCHLLIYMAHSLAQ